MYQIFKPNYESYFGCTVFDGIIAFFVITPQNKFCTGGGGCYDVCDNGNIYVSVWDGNEYQGTDTAFFGSNGCINIDNGCVV